MLERAISCRQQCMCCLSDCHMAVLIKTALWSSSLFRHGEKRTFKRTFAGRFWRSSAGDCTAHALFVCSSTRTRGDAVLCRVTLHTCFCRVCSVLSGAECGQTARLLEHAVPQVEVVVVVVVVVVEHAVLVVLVNRSSVGWQAHAQHSDSHDESVQPHGQRSRTNMRQLLGLPLCIIIMIYSHQQVRIKSTNISVSSADKKGQLRTRSLTDNNSSRSNTEALCCVEIGELTCV